MSSQYKIDWHFKTKAPGTHIIKIDREYFDDLVFPDPWPNRPWIFGIIVASANGVAGWRPKNENDAPVAAILGPDPHRPDRVADMLGLREKRTVGDMSIGAETIRREKSLVQTPQEPGDNQPEFQDLYRKFYAMRKALGLSHHPRSVIYSRGGDLSAQANHPIFNTKGVTPILITTNKGADEFGMSWPSGKGSVRVISEPDLDNIGLLRAHERLFSEIGIRYLDCEGGPTIHHLLHNAGLLDEIFVTTTDSIIDESAHEGIIKTIDFESAGARLIAEGRVPAGTWTFRRWRFTDR